MFAVNQYARYLIDRKESYEKAVMWIPIYLKRTISRGMVIEPTRYVCLEYVCQSMIYKIQ